MTLQVNLVNLGTYPNDGTGDDLRAAFVKSNENFQSLSDNVLLDAINLGTGTPIFLDKSNNTLRFRSIKTSNANVAISYDSNSITLSVKDSINRLQEDSDPILGGNLVLNGFDIEGSGNINIVGDITANSITGSFNGDFSGNISGDITGNLYGNVFGNVTGNVSGDVSGDLYGNVFGDVFGDVEGQVSDITNHALSDLSNVRDSIPTTGQALVWNGTSWGPGDVTLSSVVTKIVAGDNITITPSGGTGEVTVSATAPTVTFNDYDFGLLSGVRNAFDLIMQFTDVDFGSISSPSSVNLDLGTITELVALYNLSADVSSVVEGDTFNISLTTVNVPNGTVVPYTISGVSPSDVGAVSLTGTLTVNNGFASILFTAMPDVFTETETFTFTLDGIVPTVAVSVIILDAGSGYVSGDIDGGNPGTTTFTVVVDGGNPSTTSFSVIADGGIAASSVDGGNPGTVSFTQILEGGNPSSSPTEVYDGGLVA